MFTGIVEEIGRIESIQSNGVAISMHISAKTILADLAVDDSVCVSGVCLTATSVTPDTFTVDAVEETLRKTTLAGLRRESLVNLERSLRFADRIGGHIMQGHVDSVGEVLDVKPGSTGAMLTLRLPKEKMRYIISEGSIAVDGVSLTVARLRSNEVTIALIPHTLEKTTLGHLHPGNRVNIEVDLIGKYVENMIDSARKPAAGNAFKTLV